VNAALNFLAFFAESSFNAALRPGLRPAIYNLARLVVTSAPVVFAVSIFSGAMLTVQAAASFSLIGGGPLSATIVGFGGVREVFPLLAGGAVATRTGAEFASELGTMKVGHQIDAIRGMGLDPNRLLVGPRVFACAVGTPICVIFADIIGLGGAQLVGWLQLGMDKGHLWQNLTNSVAHLDFIVGAIKGFAFGWLIGIITTFEGLAAHGGPSGVGQATNKAVVRAMVAGCVVSLIITYAVYGGTTMTDS
jgi:phospholipid/cholesterol/gamma-HCH transport system permease protein